MQLLKAAAHSCYSLIAIIRGNRVHYAVPSHLRHKALHSQFWVYIAGALGQHGLQLLALDRVFDSVAEMVL